MTFASAGLLPSSSLILVPEAAPPSVGSRATGAVSSLTLYCCVVASWLLDCLWCGALCVSHSHHAPLNSRRRQSLGLLGPLGRQFFLSPSRPWGGEFALTASPAPLRSRSRVTLVPILRFMGWNQGQAQAQGAGRQRGGAGQGGPGESARAFLWCSAVLLTTGLWVSGDRDPNTYWNGNSTAFEDRR